MPFKASYFHKQIITRDHDELCTDPAYAANKEYISYEPCIFLRLHCLDQLCPTQLAYWAKSYVTALTRAADWMTYLWEPHIEWLTLILAI